MFTNFWKLITRQSQIEFLERELETVRQEKNALQETLHHVLRIHLIPENLEQMRQQPANQPLSISRPRSVRSFLNEQQRKSFDDSTRKEIEKVEEELNKTGTDSLETF
jgi:hypothetical protein